MIAGAAQPPIELSARAVSILYVVCSLSAGSVVIGLRGQVADTLHIPEAVATPVLVASTLMPLLFPILLRFHRILGPASGVAMALAVTVVQPRMVTDTMRNTTHGNDQGECIIVGLDGLLHSRWPYDATQMSKGNPLSCGPLWLVAHLPTAVIGYSAAFFVIMAGALLVLGCLCGWATVSKLLVLLGLTPVIWLSLLIGSDFVTFGVYVAALAAAAASTHPVLRRVAIPASVLAAHFRLPFAGLPAVFFLRRDRQGRLSGIRLAAVTSAASAGLWTLFYALDTERFVDMGPLHVLGKVEVMVDLRVNRVAAIVALVVFSVVLALVCSRFDTISGTVVFTAAILLPMVLANLYQLARHAYPHWEGAFWLVPLIVLAAFSRAARTTAHG